mmetsp:Transcript_10320/g.18192  ORF Transcript_10320/g.18192 Transcript_10320/m.18192 type:complete len:154 (+) Transcript_10320:69-530(+)
MRDAAQRRVQALARQLQSRSAPKCEPRCTCGRCVKGGDGPGLDPMPCSAENMRRFTAAELREYDGKDDKPVYLALRDIVFDVSKGRSFYGPGGGYEMLGGRDASRALALMSMDPKDVENPSLDGLDAKAHQQLDEWIEKLKAKYPIIGRFDKH